MKNLISFLKTQYVKTLIIFIKINKFKELKPRYNEKKEENSIARDTVSEIYNKKISKLDEKYNELLNARNKGFALNTIFVNYFLDHNHDFLYHH